MDANIALRIKNSRKEAGLSQEEAAETMKMSRPTLSAIESGKRNVTAEEIIHFAEMYSVSASYLLYGKKEKNPQVDRLLAYSSLFSKLKAGDQKKIISLMEEMTSKR